ncbi:RHS repeat-associated core domain-containing protein [Desulfovibrio sp. JC022]|uniref:RHS repeat-associated core domain-containing protein n=1 Tax=Desulfovibrio sp. JC022 TaxID=2593642 RepID=UPI0013D24239|nr:RHS repeat-associated core domain-containing protein [Desulfovibrio sp. JC022]NDV23962.1 hypothetical protein [Desulfovibrio sp. JC022]
MSFRNDFTLRPKKREDLNLALRMYGENEPPEMQIENMWEVYSPSTGMALPEPLADFSEFSRGDRMYPSMMKPEVKVRWEQKNKEWEIEKERYAWRKRLAHLRFMRENPDLPLAQDLAQTDYGKALIEEFIPEHPEPQQPQTGTGEDLHDEFERDGVEFDPEDAIRVTSFIVPGTEEPFSVLATARDEDGRIVGKLCSLEPKDHLLQYEYDAGGRLCNVWKDERLIEEYKYGKQGERYFGSTPQTGQCRFTYGPGVRLERAGEVKYSYDGEGRLVMKQDGLDVTTYEYHHSGQLEQVNLPDGRRISYVIDPQGRRMAKSVNGKVAETYSWYDFTTLAVVAFEDGSRMEFAYDNEGDPVAMRYNGEVYCFASDQVGTIYMVANEAGHEVKRIIRDSFGNLIVDTNERMNIPLGFAAGLYDRDTGLVHFGHREYDPSIGRFITPDPLGLEGGDVDVYGYCHDDPVNFVDRVGLKKESEQGHGGTGGSRSSSSRGYSGGDFGLGYDGTSGSAYGPTNGGWGYNTDPGGSHYGGGNTLGGEGQSRNARNNARFDQQSLQSLEQLNKANQQQARKTEKRAQELANKQTQFDAQEQAKQDRRDRARAERIEGQRRAAVVANKDEKKGKGFFEKVGNYVEDGIKEARDFTGYDKAKEIAREELAKRGRGSHNNEGDAMRHAEWSRRMTEDLGPARAWAFGTAHEIDGLINKNQPWNEAMMDIHNNAVGRAAGKAKRAVNNNNLQKSPKQGSQINPYSN